MAGVDLAGLDPADRESLVDAARTPGAEWGRCQRHPGQPTAPYDRRHCWHGCPLPESLEELAARTPPSLRGNLLDLLPDRADELIGLLLETGDLVRS
jgi:hypothetical protein